MGSSAFDGMKDAKRGYTSNAIRPGRYLLRIDENTFFDSDNNGEIWKVTLTVLAVEEGDHTVGEQVNVFFNVGTGKVRKEIFQRNLKGYIAGVLDCDDEEVGKEQTVEASSDNSPMNGLVTMVTVRRKASQSSKDENGNPNMYNVYGWTPSLSDEEIASAIGAEAVAQFFGS